MVKALMVAGATSDAGKTLLSAALCRHFSQKGYRVAPFKTLNISLNAYSTADGKEIGISQAFQAWAAGIEPAACMNPILIKPHAPGRCQYVVCGRPVDMPEHEGMREDLMERAAACYRKVAAMADIVICEGSGSPAEPNLRDRDLANMRTARMAGAPVLLVGDIDAGGVFAGIYGTWALLAQEDRALVKGYIINRFRGDPSVLGPGIDELSRRMGCPCLGVVPYVPLRFPAEDSCSLRNTDVPGGGNGDMRAVWISNLDRFLEVVRASLDLGTIERILGEGIHGL